MNRSPSSKLAASTRSSLAKEVLAFSRSRAALEAFRFCALARGPSPAAGGVYTTAYTIRPQRTCLSILLIRSLLFHPFNKIFLFTNLVRMAIIIEK